MTSAHVVRDAINIKILTSAGLVAAHLVKVDVADDVALLKVTGRFTPLPLVASRKVRLGNTVATVGFPNIGLQGFSPKATKGEISSLSGAHDDPRFSKSACRFSPVARAVH